jgi:DNA polymerase-4
VLEEGHLGVEQPEEALGIGNRRFGSVYAGAVQTTGGELDGGPGSGLGRRAGLAYRVPMIVAHLDLDAFFAAVEELENPELRTQPLVVGGDPRGRGVVATANYEARKFGIHSAMSCAEALRRCPRAVFVTPRKSLYSEYSRVVWDVVRQVVPTVERTGMDEGYLDLAEVARDFGHARAVAEGVQAAVRGSTSLTCSLGVATCKVVAKVASDRRKPGGLTVVLPGREGVFLAPFEVRLLPGVGPRSERRLRDADIATIGALAALADDELKRLLPGKVGRLLRDRARGIDPRGLEPAVDTVSISSEETFAQDVADPERLHDELRRMAEQVAQRLRRTGEVARTVTAKLRYADFSIRSRSLTLPVGTDDAERIGELACSLLDRALRDRPGPLRLVGVGVSGLEPYRQLALV